MHFWEIWAYIIPGILVNGPDSMTVGSSLLTFMSSLTSQPLIIFNHITLHYITFEYLQIYITAIYKYNNLEREEKEYDTVAQQQVLDAGTNYR